jgi:ribosomal protein S18 acetylase RimI-like enzyme
MHLHIVRTDSRNCDFIRLIELLDKELDERYGELQKQYNNYNKVDHIDETVIIYKDGIAVACGAYKVHDKEAVELKRIIVMKEHRNHGLAKLLVNELEKSAKNKGYRYALLETGIKQHEAIKLYKGCGYMETDNFEPYVGNTNSLCMKKTL